MRRHEFHEARAKRCATQAARRSHQKKQRRGGSENARVGCEENTATEYQHAKPDARARVQTPDYPRCVQRTDKCAGPPCAVQPTITNSAAMQNAVVQWSRNNALREHSSHKERHADSDQCDCGTMPQVGKSLAQFMQEAVKWMRILQLLAERFRLCNRDASFANEQITGDRYDISAEVEQQHSAEMKVVINESDHSARDQPAALHACHQEIARVRVLRLRRELLNERGHRWPEHPESSGNEGVHQIQFPELHFAG